MQSVSITSLDIQNNNNVNESNKLWYILTALIVFSIFWIIYTKNKNNDNKKNNNKSSKTKLIIIILAIAILVFLFFYKF